MANRKDIETEIMRLQSQLEKMQDEGEDHEVWIKDGGREYKVTGARAQKILDRWADLWAEQVEDAGEETEEMGEEHEEPEIKTDGKKPAPGAAGGSYFRKR